MDRDREAFRNRFWRWKNGEKVYDNGVPTAILEVDKSDADFAKRLRSNWREEIWDWEKTGNAVTHKMAGFDNIVYPNVLTTKGGGLIDFTNPIWKGNVDPAKRALKNGDYVPMKTEQDAIWFGPNYKNYYPGFKNGKLPEFRGGKGDGMKYIWDDQTHKWDRITDSDVANTMAEWVFTPITTRAKFDYENNPNPIQPLSKNETIVPDNTLWTRLLAEKANNTRTWMSDVADVLHSVGEGAMAASTFATPEIEPLVYLTYKITTNAIKDRMAAAIYRNIVPASYSESYMPYGKLEEVANAAADFLSPFKKLELTNEKWRPWLNERMPKGFITDAVAARDEIYRKYLSLHNKDFYYIKNTDGTLSHNLKNHHWRDVLKQINSAEYNDPTLSGVNTNSFDLINSAGGEINQSIKQVSPNNAVFLYNDVWDVNPFLSPDRMGNILPALLIKKYTHSDKNNKLVWNKDIPKYVEKLKNFELSDLTNGKPQPVKTNIDVLLLDRNKYMYDRKMSDSEIIDEMAKRDFDILSELIEDWDDLLFKEVKNSSFQRSMKAFLENPDKFRGIFNTPEPYSDQELYNMYGHFLRRYKDGKSPIHINPANRGKFNATKKRTGKTTEQLAHSSNPLTRKRAIFALNARKWHH